MTANLPEPVRGMYASLVRIKASRVSIQHADDLLAIEDGIDALAARAENLERARLFLMGEANDARAAQRQAEAKAEAHARDAGRWAKVRRVLLSEDGPNHRMAVAMLHAIPHEFDAAVDAMQEPQPK